MRYSRFIIVFVLLLLCKANFVNAQNSDLKLRAGLKIDKDLTKKIALSFESQVRFENNWSDFDKFLLEPSIKIEVWKDLSIGAVYRYAQEQNKTKQIYGKQRAGVSIRYKYSIASAWDLKVKTALQYDTRSFLTGYNPKDNEWTNRNKLALEYAVFGLPLTVEVGGEIFSNLNITRQLEQVRTSLQFDYEFVKNSRIALQYLNDYKMNSVGKSNHVFVLMYRLKI